MRQHLPDMNEIRKAFTHVSMQVFCYLKDTFLVNHNVKSLTSLYSRRRFSHANIITQQQQDLGWQLIHLGKQVIEIDSMNQFSMIILICEKLKRIDYTACTYQSCGKQCNIVTAIRIYLLKQSQCVRACNLQQVAS